MPEQAEDLAINAEEESAVDEQSETETVVANDSDTSTSTEPIENQTEPVDELPFPTDEDVNQAVLLSVQQQASRPHAEDLGRQTNPDTLISEKPTLDEPVVDDFIVV